MKTLKEYIINFGRLMPGKHEYSFEIGPEFFSQFEYSLVKHGRLHLELELDKQKETFFTMNFHLKGYLALECDRCLDDFNYELDDKQRILVKLEEREHDANEADELLFLPLGTYEIDISPLIYEFINLQLPLRRTCDLGDKDCNEKMLEHLKKVNEANEKKEIDPRWEGLKDINKDKK